VAKRAKLSPLGDGDETTQATPRDVLEEDPFDRVPGAEAEDLILLGLDQLRGQARETVDAVRDLSCTRNP